MGLSSKHVSGDGLEWAGLQSGAAELSKPPPIRRQPPPHQQSEPLNCPRCNSANTKFCYYNNYNKSQPRHFCKSCKRHWTKGGTLRNVPVGGGRKNKRAKISKPAPAARQPDFPLSGNSNGAQKSMPNNTIFYQALLHETTKGFMGSASSAGLNASSSPSNNLPSEFQFSSLSTLDMNVSWNPTSYQPLNAFDHYAANLDSIEESTVTTVNIPSSSSGPWPGPDSSSTLDLPSYWNWGDIDVLNSGDLNMSWDEDVDNAEIKPRSKIN